MTSNAEDFSDALSIERKVQESDPAAQAIRIAFCKLVRTHAHSRVAELEQELRKVVSMANVAFDRSVLTVRLTLAMDYEIFWKNTDRVLRIIVTQQELASYKSCMAALGLD